MDRDSGLRSARILDIRINDDGEASYNLAIPIPVYEIDVEIDRVGKARATEFCQTGPVAIEAGDHAAVQIVRNPIPVRIDTARIGVIFS